MDYLMGIDIGTSATKTALFCQDGRLVAQAAKEHPLYQPRNGWAEQRPEDWWEGVLETMASVARQAGSQWGCIKAIGLTGQMHGLVMLDQAGKVIRPSIIWCDQRTGEEVKDMEAAMPRERWLQITANPPLAGWTAAKILWVKKHEPEHYARCRHILLPKDYIRYMLTGEFATEVSDASGMQLLDVPNRRWSQEVLDRLGIDPSLLGKVYESCQVTGTLRPEIAEKTGLPPGVAVAGGAGDNGAAAVGTGAVEDGAAFTTIGTSGVVYAHASKLAMDPKGRVQACCCAVPGAWHVMGVTQGAGLSLKWFKDQFCQDYVEKARIQGVDPYDLINRDVAAMPLGSHKLIYLPYLMGERTPHLDPDCRGVFFGLSPVHTRAHMLRAVMEGVSYSLKDCHDLLAQMGVEARDMMVCGGGAKSLVWRQMLADLYGCQVTTLAQDQGPALGAAILAGVAWGTYGTVEEACHMLLKEGQACQPIPSHVEKYKKYHRLYKKLYGDLKEDFQRLGEL